MLRIDHPCARSRETESGEDPGFPERQPNHSVRMRNSSASVRFGVTGRLLAGICGEYCSDQRIQDGFGLMFGGRYQEFCIVNRDILLDLFYTDGRFASGTYDRPDKGNLHAVDLAIIAVVDLGWIKAQGGFGKAHKPHKS